MDPIAAKICEYYPETQAVYLFGTHGTEEARPDSDVDIALLLPYERAQMTASLNCSPCRQALENILGREVDLVNLRLANTVLRHEIVTTGRLIYCSDGYAQETFEMLTLSYYQRLNEERADILRDIMASGKILAV